MSDETEQPVKRKRGRPRKNPVETPAPPIDLDNAKGGLGVEWCEAVLWAAEHVHVANMTRKKAGSMLRYSLWQFGREDAKTLVSQMAIKALNFLQANKKEDDIAELEEVENKSIKELQELLAGAIAEMGEV